MIKRSAATVLWFFAVWALYDLVALLTGAPKPIGPALGAALAAFVAMDPLRVIWVPKATRPLR